MTLRRTERHCQQVASHRDAATHRRILLAATAAATAVALLLPACSQLPIEPLEAHRDHDVVVDFLAPADGRIALPTSDASLRIDRVDWTPEPIGESFAAGVRSFVFPPGTRAAARLRFRTFAPPGGEAASAAATLPHAIALRLADAP